MRFTRRTPGMEIRNERIGKHINPKSKAMVVNGHDSCEQCCNTKGFTHLRGVGVFIAKYKVS